MCENSKKKIWGGGLGGQGGCEWRSESFVKIQKKKKWGGGVGSRGGGVGGGGGVRVDGNGELKLLCKFIFFFLGGVGSRGGGLGGGSGWMGTEN